MTHKLPDPQFHLLRNGDDISMGNDTCSAHLVAKMMKKHSFIDSQLPLEKLPKNLGLCPSRDTESLSDTEQSPSLET